MTDERFNELLNGPLDHPFPMFRLTRLARALGYVVSQTGTAGAAALEEFCKAQDMTDRIKSGDEYPTDYDDGPPSGE